MEEFQKHLYVLILAGGGGTRLWPLSREQSPKQFLRLFGGKSLFNLTLERAKKLTDPKKIFISTSAGYRSFVTKNSLGIPPENIIAEPMRRDTALGMGVPALFIHHLDPEAVIINLASDHLISPLSTFTNDMLLAARKAYSENKIVTVGIKPRFPHTGMGHIKVQGEIGVQFVEKPNLEVAKKFTASGHYYWNANLYVWRAKLVLDLLKKYSPKTVANFPLLEKTIGGDRERESLQLVFQMAPKISIDYAVSEKLHNFICLRAHFDWTDIGDWSEVYNNLPKDKIGNVIYGEKGKGKFIGIDSTKNLFVLDRKLVVGIGVENLIVVDTKDAILICKADDDQAVKTVVEVLKEQKLTEYL